MNSLKALQNPYDICVLGDEESGKSSLILRYLHNKFIDLDSSIEDLYTKTIRNELSYNQYTILDASSAVDYNSNAKRNQIKNARTLMLVYAIDSYDLFTGAQDIYERAAHILGGKINLPIVMVGTKSDMRDQREVSFHEARGYAQSIGALKIVECSSKDGIAIDVAFEPLIDFVASNRIAAAKPQVEAIQVSEEIETGDELIKAQSDKFNIFNETKPESPTTPRDKRYSTPKYAENMDPKACCVIV